MAVDIGPKIGIDGEAKFRSQLNSLSETVKTYGAELKAVSTQTDEFTSAEDRNKAKALTLQSAIESQKKKMALLAKAVQESSEKYGEHDQKTEKWKQALANAQTQLNGMENELKSCTEETKKSADAAEQGSSKWEGFGNVVKGAAVAIGAAVAAAAAASVELGKAVVESFADYEQLTGGVETLFKDSSVLVQKYAEDAYKNSGLSANEYMETVTGFSASLISSLEGDTTKAAVYADQAIKDMSDNANKMGSDISSLQSAYSGFAKGNYTMLDNLKLGYGGTKTEMERLIADANAMKEANGEMGDLTINSYADIITAIHMVQTEMGITGTTAKEAEGTISGSIAMTKSAYENFITALGSGEGLDSALRKMIDSALLVVSNITPVVERLVQAIPEVVMAIIPVIMEQTPLLLNTSLDLFSQILGVLVSSLPMVADTIMQVVMTASQTVLDNLDTFLEVGMEVLISLLEGIIKALPEIIQTVTDVIISFTDNISAHIPDIIKLGVDLLIALSVGLFQAIPQLIIQIPEIIVAIVDAFVQYDWAGVGKNILEGIADGFVNAFENVKQKFVDTCEKIGNTVKGWFGIESPSKWMRDQVGGNLMAGLEVGLEKYSDGAVNTAKKVSEQIGKSFSINYGSMYTTGRSANLMLTTPVYLDGRVIASVVNQQLGVIL